MGQKFDSYDEFEEAVAAKRGRNLRQRTEKRIEDLARGFAAQPMLNETEWDDVGDQAKHFKKKVAIPELKRELEAAAAREASARARLASQGLDQDEIELNLFDEIKRSGS